MKASLRRAGLVTIALAAGATAGRPAPSPSPAAARDLSHVAPQERAAYVRRAIVWQPTNVAAKDLLAGPAGDDAFKFDESVACDYITPLAPLKGTTPKFDCGLKPDDVVKVKYGRKNGEVYAEVAATRLFWALGFGADRMYPVQVTCHNCPIEPWYWSTDEKDGGVPRAHRDALKLLMGLIQNSDTKPDNQRILCPPEEVKTDAAGNETCGRALLYVQDLGYAFGEATLFDTKKNDLESWKGEPIWKDPAQCMGNLKKSLPGTLKADPRISEAGRKFLADLLVQLSDKQITDMFTAARVERFHVHPERNLPVSEWVAVFKKKRDEIVTAHCPS